MLTVRAKYGGVGGWGYSAEKKKCVSHLLNVNVLAMALALFTHDHTTFVIQFYFGLSHFIVIYAVLSF